MTDIAPTVIEIHGQKPDWLWPGYCCSLDKELQRNYGITCADYNRMFINQEGLCAIKSCRQPPGTYKLAVDHDPETGEIRGLIHMRHNRLLTKEVVEYVTNPPARKFGLKVSKAKQRKLDQRRKARQKRPEPNGQTPQPASDLSYEEAIKAILEK
jgi:hypothetical protein